MRFAGIERLDAAESLRTLVERHTPRRCSTPERSSNRRCSTPGEPSHLQVLPGASVLLLSRVFCAADRQPAVVTKHFSARTSAA
jgi:hypothetical protein